MTTTSGSSGGIVEFLNELTETESVSALQNALSQRSVFVFKLAEFTTTLQANIESFVAKRVILNKDISDMKFNTDQDVSIKFNLGTEVYFVKTKLKTYQNKVYFDMSAKVLQLKRRKEPRFLIPAKWNQTALIVGNTRNVASINCHVQDISLSGIRFEVVQSAVTYKRDDVLKVQFQIYKRAEINTEAIVRFFLKRNNLPSLLGMEFFDLKSIQQERIAHIISDIANYQTSLKL